MVGILLYRMEVALWSIDSLAVQRTKELEAEWEEETMVMMDGEEMLEGYLVDPTNRSRYWTLVLSKIYFSTSQEKVEIL